MAGRMVHEIGLAARCLRLRATLQAYLDGEADPARAEAMTAHLAECRRCGLGAEAYASLQVALAARSPLSEVDPVAQERLEAFAASLVPNQGVHGGGPHDGSSGDDLPPR